MFSLRIMKNYLRIPSIPPHIWSSEIQMPMLTAVRSASNHGGESRDLNDRVHGISCRYSDKNVNKLITLFLLPNRFSSNKHTYLLLIRSKHSSQSYYSICSCFPQKSEPILFSVFRLCSDFSGKLLYIVEKHLDE